MQKIAGKRWRARGSEAVGRFQHQHQHHDSQDRRSTMSLVDTAAAGSWDTLKLSPFVCVGYLSGGACACADRDATD